MSSDRYDIQRELEVRKLLEEETEWSFEFTKNEKYAPDLQLHDWGEPPVDAGSRSLIGYVEIEVASKSSDWQRGRFPDHWNEASFLRRKIQDWDYDRQNWAGLKPLARQTLYLKFNHQLDNCFMAPVERIYHDYDYRTTRRGAESPNRKQDVYVLHPKNKTVVWGVHDCVREIEGWLDKIEDDQHSLTDFSTDGGQTNE